MRDVIDFVKDTLRKEGVDMTGFEFHSGPGGTALIVYVKGHNFAHVDAFRDFGWVGPIMGHGDTEYVVQVQAGKAYISEEGHIVSTVTLACEERGSVQ